MQFFLRKIFVSVFILVSFTLIALAFAGLGLGIDNSWAQNSDDTSAFPESTLSQTDPSLNSDEATTSEDLPLDGDSAELPVLQAMIDSPDVVEAKKNIILAASRLPKIDSDDNFSYVWQFGDGGRSEGVEVVHTYKNAGTYKVQLLVRNQLTGEEAVTEKEVFAYTSSLLLLTDKAGEREKIDNIIERARVDHFVNVVLIESYDSVSEFLSEEVLIRQLGEHVNDLNKSRFLLIWTDGSLGLNAVSHFKRSELGAKADFSNKSLVFIYDGGLSSYENIAAGTYKSVRPEKIVLTRAEAILPLLGSEKLPDFLVNLENSLIDYRLVDAASLVVKPWNLVSSLVNFMVDNGVPTNTIALILMLPLIAMVIAFLRQVVGVSTMGIYVPTILTLSFIALDLRYGLLMVAFVVAVGTLLRLGIRQYRLLYIPRVAILFTVVSFAMLLLLALGAYFSIGPIVTLSVFPLLMMVALVEKFVTVQYDHGFRTAMLLSIETVAVAVLCFYIVEWDPLKTFILGHPEIIFLFLLVNIFLGRWTGLRLFEYIRFRSILFRSNEE